MSANPPFTNRRRTHSLLRRGSVEAERQKTDALTVEVKRLVARSRDQGAAAAELCALGDEAIGILCSLAQAEGRRKRRICWLSFSVMFLGHVARYIAIHIHSEAAQISAICISFIGAMGGILVTLFPAKATMMLSNMDDTRTVGSLIDALAAHILGSDLNGTIRDSLKRLLPRLRASDAERLLRRHIDALNKEIDFRRVWRGNVGGGVSYTLALLKALEQVGDETSVASVERVLQTTKNPKIREAAEACLPFLQARAVMGRHTLLRAASEEGGELLRAAQGSDEPETHVLLRPVSDRAGTTKGSEPQLLLNVIGESTEETW
jgi:hypothetical protein